MRSNESARSSGTSGLAFSLMVNDAEVWLRKMCARPTSNSVISGRRCNNGWVMTWHPRGYAGSSSTLLTHSVPRGVEGAVVGSLEPTASAKEDKYHIKINII